MFKVHGYDEKRKNMVKTTQERFQGERRSGNPRINYTSKIYHDSAVPQALVLSYGRATTVLTVYARGTSTGELYTTINAD